MSTEKRRASGDKTEGKYGKKQCPWARERFFLLRTDLQLQTRDWPKLGEKYSRLKRHRQHIKDTSAYWFFNGPSKIKERLQRTFTGHYICFALIGKMARLEERGKL